MELVSVKRDSERTFVYSLSPPRELNTLDSRCTRGAHDDAKTGHHLKCVHVQNQYLSLGVACVNMLSPSIKRGHNVQVALEEDRRGGGLLAQSESRIKNNQHPSPRAGTGGLHLSPPARPHIAWDRPAVGCHCADQTGLSRRAREIGTCAPVRRSTRPKYTHCCPWRRKVTEKYITI